MLKDWGKKRGWGKVTFDTFRGEWLNYEMKDIPSDPLLTPSVENSPEEVIPPAALPAEIESKVVAPEAVGPEAKPEISAEEKKRQYQEEKASESLVRDRLFTNPETKALSEQFREKQKVGDKVAVAEINSKLVEVRKRITKGALEEMKGSDPKEYEKLIEWQFSNQVLYEMLKAPEYKRVMEEYESERDEGIRNFKQQLEGRLIGNFSFSHSLFIGQAIDKISARPHNKNVPRGAWGFLYWTNLSKSRYVGHVQEKEESKRAAEKK